MSSCWGTADLGLYDMRKRCNVVKCSDPSSLQQVALSNWNTKSPYPTIVKMKACRSETAAIVKSANENPEEWRLKCLSFEKAGDGSAIDISTKETKPVTKNALDTALRDEYEIECVHPIEGNVSSYGEYVRYCEKNAVENGAPSVYAIHEEVHHCLSDVAMARGGLLGLLASTDVFGGLPGHSGQFTMGGSKYHFALHQEDGGLSSMNVSLLRPDGVDTVKLWLFVDFSNSNAKQKYIDEMKRCRHAMDGHGCEMQFGELIKLFPVGALLQRPGECLLTQWNWAHCIYGEAGLVSYAYSANFAHLSTASVERMLGAAEWYEQNPSESCQYCQTKNEYYRGDELSLCFGNAANKMNVDEVRSLTRWKRDLEKGDVEAVQYSNRETALYSDFQRRDRCNSESKEEMLFEEYFEEMKWIEPSKYFVRKDDKNRRSRSEFVKHNYPYSCHHCHKRFASKHGAHRHQILLSNFRQYECVDCKKQFINKRSFQKHIKLKCCKKRNAWFWFGM